MIRTDIGADNRLPELCGRCASVVALDHPEALEEGLEK
jgi:isoleucyl-tRNA synthetase